MSDPKATNGIARHDISPEEGSWSDLVRELQPVNKVDSGDDTHRSIPLEEDKTHSRIEIEQVNTAPTPDRPMTRYEQLCKLPSMQMERADMDVMVEFSEVIALVNKAGRSATKLRDNHPYALPEHITNMIRNNLKETATVMLRELHIMRNGRAKKTYEKKFVCKSCHSVFMVPLPGDGICDECRAGMTPRSSPY